MKEKLGKGELARHCPSDTFAPIWKQLSVMSISKSGRDIQGVFFTGPPLKGGPVQNHVKVPRLVLPWSSPKS